jgi:hypothetical protein
MNRQKRVVGGNVTFFDTRRIEDGGFDLEPNRLLEGQVEE